MAQADVKKVKSSDLRRRIKFFKHHSNDVELLRQNLHLLMMAIRLSDDPKDTAWQAEGLHQVALFHSLDGDVAKSEQFFIESLSTFKQDELLGRCRTLRDYALLYATSGEYPYALMIARSSLQLHDEDIALFAPDSEAERKGKRQKRITQSYIWNIKLDGPLSDTETLDKLVEFALHECLDCCERDQEQIMSFALAHAPAQYRHKLRVRLGLHYAKRLEPVAFTGNLIRLSIDIPLYISGRALNTLFRKE